MHIRKTPREAAAAQTTCHAVIPNENMSEEMEGGGVGSSASSGAMKRGVPLMEDTLLWDALMT